MRAGALGRTLSWILEVSHTATFEQLPGLLGAAAREAGAGGARLFLADLQQEVLREVTGIGLDAGRGGEEARIEGTLPGRAYQTLEITTPHTGGPCWRRYSMAPNAWASCASTLPPARRTRPTTTWCGCWRRWRAFC